MDFFDTPLKKNKFVLLRKYIYCFGLTYSDIKLKNSLFFYMIISFYIFQLVCFFNTEKISLFYIKISLSYFTLQNIFLKQKTIFTFIYTVITLLEIISFSGFFIICAVFLKKKNVHQKPKLISFYLYCNKTIHIFHNKIFSFFYLNNIFMFFFKNETFWENFESSFLQNYIIILLFINCFIFALSIIFDIVFNIINSNNFAIKNWTVVLLLNLLKVLFFLNKNAGLIDNYHFSIMIKIAFFCISVISIFIKSFINVKKENFFSNVLLVCATLTIFDLVIQITGKEIHEISKILYYFLLIKIREIIITELATKRITNLFKELSNENLDKKVVDAFLKKISFLISNYQNMKVSKKILKNLIFEHISRTPKLHYLLSQIHKRLDKFFLIEYFKGAHNLYKLIDLDTTSKNSDYIQLYFQETIYTKKYHRNFYMEKIFLQRLFTFKLKFNFRLNLIYLYNKNNSYLMEHQNKGYKKFYQTQTEFIEMNKKIDDLKNELVNFTNNFQVFFKEKHYLIKNNQKIFRFLVRSKTKINKIYQSLNKYKESDFCLFMLGLLELLVFNHSQKSSTFLKKLKVFTDSKRYQLNDNFKLSTKNISKNMIVIVNGSLDKLGNVDEIFYNYKEFVGYEKTELIGHPIEILIPDLIAVKHQYFLKEFYRTGIYNFINKQRLIFMKHKEDHIIPGEVYIRILVNYNFGLKFVGSFNNQFSSIKEMIIDNSADEKYYFFMLNNIFNVVMMSKNMKILFESRNIFQENCRNKDIKDFHLYDIFPDLINPDLMKKFLVKKSIFIKMNSFKKEPKIKENSFELNITKTKTIGFVDQIDRITQRGFDRKNMEISSIDDEMPNKRNSYILENKENVEFNIQELNTEKDIWVNLRLICCDFQLYSESKNYSVFFVIESNCKKNVLIPGKRIKCDVNERIKDVIENKISNEVFLKTNNLKKEKKTKIFKKKNSLSKFLVLSKFLLFLIAALFIIKNIFINEHFKKISNSMLPFITLISKLNLIHLNNFQICQVLNTLQNVENIQADKNKEEIDLFLEEEFKNLKIFNKYQQQNITFVFSSFYELDLIDQKSVLFNYSLVFEKKEKLEGASPIESNYQFGYEIKTFSPDFISALNILLNQVRNLEKSEKDMFSSDPKTSTEMEAKRKEFNKAVIFFRINVFKVFAQNELESKDQLFEILKSNINTFKQFEFVLDMIFLAIIIVVFFFVIFSIKQTEASIQSLYSKFIEFDKFIRDKIIDNCLVYLSTLSYIEKNKFNSLELDDFYFKRKNQFREKKISFLNKNENSLKFLKKTNQKNLKNTSSKFSLALFRNSKTLKFFFMFLLIPFVLVIDTFVIKKQIKITNSFKIFRELSNFQSLFTQDLFLNFESIFNSNQIIGTEELTRNSDLLKLSIHDFRLLYPLNKFHNENYFDFWQDFFLFNTNFCDYERLILAVLLPECDINNKDNIRNKGIDFLVALFSNRLRLNFENYNSSLGQENNQKKFFFDNLDFRKLYLESVKSLENAISIFIKALEREVEQYSADKKMSFFVMGFVMIFISMILSVFLLHYLKNILHKKRILYEILPNQINY